MRSISNVSSDAAELVARDDTHWDALFRDPKGRVVDPVTVYGAPIADTHCHLDMLPHPELSIARAAYHGIRFLVTVVDPTENPEYTYENIDAWLARANELLVEWRSTVSESESTTAASESVAASVTETGATLPEPTAASDNAVPTLAVAKTDAMPTELADAIKLPELRVIIGCHPHNASKFDDEGLSTVIKWLDHPRTAAIGEIGLDYHYDASPREVQREAFRRQLALANERGWPVALHLRDAHEDGYEILCEQGWPEAGVLLHCYTLGPQEVKPFLEKGAHVALGGTMTFNNAWMLREAVYQIPVERLMTETDSPFMTPMPLRGTLCGPEHTLFTAAALAENRGVHGEAAVRELLQRVYQNGVEFFSHQASI